MEPFGRVKLEVRHVEGLQDHLSRSQGASSVLPPGFAIDPDDDLASDTPVIFRSPQMRLPLTFPALLRTRR